MSDTTGTTPSQTSGCLKDLFLGFIIGVFLLVACISSVYFVIWPSVSDFIGIGGPERTPAPTQVVEATAEVTVEPTITINSGTAEISPTPTFVPEIGDQVSNTPLPPTPTPLPLPLEPTPTQLSGVSVSGATADGLVGTLLCESDEEFAALGYPVFREGEGQSGSVSLNQPFGVILTNGNFIVLKYYEYDVSYPGGGYVEQMQVHRTRNSFTCQWSRSGGFGGFISIDMGRLNAIKAQITLQ